MSNLLPLATLVKFMDVHAKEMYKLGCYFPTTKFIREEKRRETVNEWLVSIASPLYRSESPSLMDACDNMIGILLEKGFVMPVMDTDDIIIIGVQTETRLLQFQELILENQCAPFAFGYWPKTSDDDLPPWEASITEGSHWDNTDLVKTRGNSLYEVCDQCMKQYSRLTKLLD